MPLIFIGELMQDEYFGIKELYEVVLKAKTPMFFGNRTLETGESILYFEKVNMALLSEKNSVVMARGGWSNMPRVIWEDRSEVQFSLTEGVMNNTSMGILLSAGVTHLDSSERIAVQKTEGPRRLIFEKSLIDELNEEDNNDNNYLFYLEHWPLEPDIKKSFIYQFDNDTIQKKVYGERIIGKTDNEGKERPCIKVYEDKEHTQPANPYAKYLVDYYYAYEDEALVYTVEKERFNGLFTLEGKFYAKDENKGINYTNIIYMPKVRVVSDINLRLGEKADPTISVFNIIGLPETQIGNKNGLILEITRLNSNIDAN